MATLSYKETVSGGSGSSAFSWSITRTYTYSITEDEREVTITVTKFQSSALSGHGSGIWSDAQKDYLLTTPYKFTYIWGSGLADRETLSSNSGASKNINLNISRKIQKIYAPQTRTLTIGTSTTTHKSETVNVPERKFTEITVYDESGNKHTGRVKVYDANGLLKDCVLSAYDLSGNLKHVKI